MTILATSLSFIPILLITLVVHEMGHYLFARWFGLQINGFQIGAGWRIASIHTGRKTIINRPGIPILNPDLPVPQAGNTASVYVSQSPDGTYLAEAILPRHKKTPLKREYWDEVRRFNENNTQLTGRVREISPERIVLADMNWSLRAIPMMAGVILAEDPQGKINGVYNTTKWRNKFLITMAGPMANIWLTIIIMLVIATFPLTIAAHTTWTIASVEANSPAEAAGLQAGDILVRINDSNITNMTDMREQLQRGPADLGFIRNSISLKAQVTPDTTTGKIGVSLAPDTTANSREHSLTPGSIARNFTHISRAYLNSLGSMARSITGSEESQGPLVTGPILGAYETALAIQYAGPKAWLIILATINLGIAILNLIPIPPLDGSRILLESIQALRKGKPINPEIERMMTLGGMGLIWMAGTYLIITDLISILEK